MFTAAYVADRFAGFIRIHKSATDPFPPPQRKIVTPKTLSKTVFFYSFNFSSVGRERNARHPFRRGGDEVKTGYLPPPLWAPLYGSKDHILSERKLKKATIKPIKPVAKLVPQNPYWRHWSSWSEVGCCKNRPADVRQTVYRRSGRRKVVKKFVL